MSAWTDHVAKWKNCDLCPLHKQRNRICIARGTVPCDVLFVGEAPGPSEDAIGQPFVGPAGKLLDQIIERALPHQGHDVYTIEASDAYAAASIQGCRRCHKSGPELVEKSCISLVTYALTNLVCCFPAEAKAEGINEPHTSEIKACRPRLTEFINITEPKLIVCVGVLAAEYIDHRAGTQCLDVIHPAFILRREMPLAQKQMAAQRVVVQIRNAVERVIESSRPNFTKWGDPHASIPSSKERPRYDYNDWARSPINANNEDIPF